MKKRTTTFIGALVAVIACIIAVAAFSFWYSVVARTTTEGALLEAQIKERETAGGRAAAARRALATLAVEEERIESYLVSSTEIVPFLESLEGVGDDVGAEVDVVSVGDSPDINNRIPLSLSISGSFNAVLQALGAIEHNPNDIRITNLTLDTPQGDAASGEWTANITFTVGMRGLPVPVATP